MAAAMAEQERRISLEQERNRTRLERQEQINREVRERELRDLRLKVTQQEWWAKSVETAARNAAIRQNRQARAQAVYGPVVAALEQKLNPPTPPEPTVEIVYVEENKDSSKLDWPVVNRWFER